MVSVDETACKACRSNNLKILENQSVDPEQGGNAAQYKSLMTAQAKTGDVEEFTYT